MLFGSLMATASAQGPFHLPKMPFSVMSKGPSVAQSRLLTAPQDHTSQPIVEVSPRDAQTEIHLGRRGPGAAESRKSFVWELQARGILERAELVRRRVALLMGPTPTLHDQFSAIARERAPHFATVTDDRCTASTG
jgi:hypothetical protein